MEESHVSHETASVRSRFFSRTRLANAPHPTLRTRCLIWTASTSGFGYGYFSGHKYSPGAHRVAWAFEHGDIPDGMQVCHSCDNPSCVNHEHLFLGTQTENNRDRDAKGRCVNPLGVAHGMAKITEADVVEIRKMKADGFSNAYIARKFGLYESHARKIALRKYWKHVP